MGREKCQGTTSVVPQDAEKKWWALAPEGSIPSISPNTLPFSAASSAVPHAPPKDISGL